MSTISYQHSHAGLEKSRVTSGKKRWILGPGAAAKVAVLYKSLRLEPSIRVWPADPLDIQRWGGHNARHVQM